MGCWCCKFNEASGQPCMGYRYSYKLPKSKHHFYIGLYVAVAVVNRHNHAPRQAIVKSVLLHSRSIYYLYIKITEV